MAIHPGFDTHEVFNQSPPYVDVDLFASDRPLRDAVAANGAEARGARAVGVRQALGHGRNVRRRRRLANENPPKLQERSMPRAFAAISSSFIRPITSSWPTASAPAWRR